MADFHYILSQRFNKWGWSYDWYGTSPGDDPEAAAVNITPGLISAWQGVHHNYVVLEAVRIINIDSPRRAFVKDFGLTFGTAGATPAHPNYSVKMQLSDGDGHTRFMQLRGLPQTWPAIDGPTGADELPGVATAAINNWGTALIQHSFAIRRKFDSTVNPYARIITASRAALPAGLTLLTIHPEITLAAGDTVYVGSVRDGRVCYLNGELKVVSYAAGQLVVDAIWPLDASTIVLLAEGRLRKVEYTLSLITSRAIYKVGSRDTGRPFGLSRGRSPGGACHR